MKILAGLATFVGFIVIGGMSYGFAFWAGSKKREIKDWWIAKKEGIKNVFFNS